MKTGKREGRRILAVVLSFVLAFAPTANAWAAETDFQEALAEEPGTFAEPDLPETGDREVPVETAGDSSEEAGPGETQPGETGPEEEDEEQTEPEDDGGG